MSEPSVETRVAVLETRHASLVDLVASMSENLRKLSEATQMLARIEEQNRAAAIQLQELRAEFKSHETDKQDLEKRVDAIERDIPQLKESRGWLVKGLGIVLAAVLAVILASVGIKPTP